MSRLSELFKKFSAEHDQMSNLHRDSRVLIVDGLNMFIGAFYASPAMNHIGEHVGGLKGFLSSILACITKFRPTRCIIVFDGRDGGINRREKFSEYKSGRRNRVRLNRYIDVAGVLDEGEALKDQFMKLGRYLSCMPVTFITMDYVEADDVIGYIVSEHYKDSDSHITVISSDKDFLQLVSPNVSVYRTSQKMLYDEAAVLNTYGIPAFNFLSYRAITGDISDNLPGVKGLGLKSLLKLVPELITERVSCEDIIDIANARINSGSKLRGYKNILDSKERVLLNAELMQLTDVDIPANKKLHISNWLRESVSKFDMKTFRRMVYADGLNHGVDFLNTNVILTLSQLDKYANSR